jgi:amino acid adenylation domain-containing protein
MNVPYFPAYGGANKSNRFLLEGLVERGHSVLAVVPSQGTPPAMTGAQLLDQLHSDGIKVHAGESVHSFRMNGVQIRAVTRASKMRAHLVDYIGAEQPDWVLVSSEDPSQNLLEAALTTGRRVVYLARTPSFLPFGPQAFFPSKSRAELLARVDRIVAVSDFVSAYIRQWSGLDSRVVPISFFGSGPFPNFGSFDRGFVTMVNPCAVKGLPIFLELAARMPEVPFAAVPSWGTTEHDRESLAALPNIRLLPAAENIDEFYRVTRVLLVPSLWEEARGRVVLEAMLRGIPVLASAVGGIGVKKGVDILLPVRPIEHFAEQLDGNMIPLATIPKQDIGPWEAALRRLLTDQAFYQKQSASSRSAAIEFNSLWNVEPFERLLLDGSGREPSVGRQPQRERDRVAPAGSATASEILSLTPEQRAVFSLRLRQKRGAGEQPSGGPGKAAEPGGPIEKAPRDGDLPLSFAQQRLWFLEQLNPGTAFYNVCQAVRIFGRLDVAALERAANFLSLRHEALRTTLISKDGTGYQVILPAVSLRVPVVDVTNLPESGRVPAATRLARQELRKPFNLTRPLQRLFLVQTGAEEHTLVINQHHAITDAWSMSLFLEELTSLYQSCHERTPVRLPDLPLQYADFAFWQRRRVELGLLEPQLRYWREQLAGAPDFLTLPLSRPRPDRQTYRGASRTMAIPAALHAGLRALCGQESATLFTVLLAAFQVFLHRYTGEDDIVVGSPVANRNRSELERIIGFFVNTLALRTRITGNPPFREVIRQVRGVVLSAYANQDLPFDLLVGELQAKRDLSRHPLFQTVFLVENTPRVPLGVPGLSLAVLPLEGETAKFDLTLAIRESAQGLAATLNYNTDLFETDVAERMLTHWMRLLEEAVAHPDGSIGALPMLSPSDRHQLVAEGNGTGSAGEVAADVVTLIECCAASDPHRAAVVCGRSVLTYGELSARSGALARFLAGTIQSEAMVGVLAEPCVEFLIAIVGILKAGAVYVPLAPDLGRSRMEAMLRDANPALVLAQPALLDRLPANVRAVPLDSDWAQIAVNGSEDLRDKPAADQLAYVIYTSGSTGAPKGVMLTRGNLAHCIRARLEYFGGRSRRHLLFWSMAVDGSIAGIFGALCAGCTLFLPGKERADPSHLADFISRNAITFAVLPPSFYALLLEQEQANPGRLTSLASVSVAAAPCAAAVASLHRAALPQATLFNEYGPTEAAVWCTVFQVESGGTPERLTPGPLPIGSAVAHTPLYVLDRYGELVPSGVSGELFVGGEGIARGYLHAPHTTAEKFVPDPFAVKPSARLYRTGDLVRRRPDGILEFLGRLDAQIKLHGFRIEPAEVEAAARRHPAIFDSVAIKREDNPGEERLVCYLVPRQNVDLAVAEVRGLLERELPPYMVPSAFVVLPKLPLGSNGKLDRGALPAPGQARPALETTFVAPQDNYQRDLAQIWEEVLHIRGVGVTDNFFALGGRSISAVRVLSRIRARFGPDVPLAALFQAPTLGELAALLRSRTPASLSALLPIHEQGNKSPLFCVHAASGAALPYLALARALGPDQPFYGLQATGLYSNTPPLRSVPELAARYLDAVRTVQPEGPYLLSGWSTGGLIAFEMAQQLVNGREAVGLVALFDSSWPAASAAPATIEKFLSSIAGVEGAPRKAMPDLTGRLRGMALDDQLRLVLATAQESGFLPHEIDLADIRRLFSVFEANVHASNTYRPAPYGGPLTLFRAAASRGSEDAEAGWGAVAAGGLDVHVVPGDHYSLMLDPANVRVLALTLARCIEQAARPAAKAIVRPYPFEPAISRIPA